MQKQAKQILSHDEELRYIFNQNYRDKLQCWLEIFGQVKMNHHSHQGKTTG